MTDRTKVDISKNMIICCKNCLNDDMMDWDSTCCQCRNHNLFLGLKEDKSCKCGYKVVLPKNSLLKSVDITAEDLLKRIEAEKKMYSQSPMFGGLSLEGVYS